MGVKRRRKMIGKKTGMLEIENQSASFNDIIEETMREDLERVWGVGGWQKKSIFYLQR